MLTEFQKLDLDELRYSIVWEEAGSLYRGLDIQADDEVLVITSAGDNVLNTLLRFPKKVTAIDLNPVQNAFLDFKRHVIDHHSFGCYRGILGLDGKQAVQDAWSEISKSLQGASLAYWQACFERCPAGLMTSGKLESYLTAFVPTLSDGLQGALRELLDCRTIEEQIAHFDSKVNSAEFKEKFIQYVDRPNLSKARDPRLFRYANESGGVFFYERLVAQSKTSLWKDNFHWRFFFFGAEGMEDGLLPPCYQEKNYETLKQVLDRLEIVEGEALDYLSATPGRHITKSSLSNIFEYTSPDEFLQSMRLLDTRGRPLKLIYWNLLQNQQYNNHPSFRSIEVPDGCFYFRNSCEVKF